MFDYNPFPNSYLGRLIWSEIERQAGEGCLSDSMADAFYMLKLKNACESFIKQPNVEAKSFLKILEQDYYVDYKEAAYLTILCDRIIQRSDDYCAWYLVCKLANATAHHYEQDTNASRGVLADALR